MINKLKWSLKQLLPLTYYTTSRTDGKRYFSIWKMWFGKPFDITHFQID